jgi:hypothetical protein
MEAHPVVVAGAGLVAITAAVIVAMAVTTDEPEYDYVSVCVENGVRLDDNSDRCPDRFDENGNAVWDEPYHPHGAMLMLINTSTGYSLPAVGQPVATGGLLAKPPTIKAGQATARIEYKKAPAAGGPVVRGGFGVKASGGSAGG